MNEAKKKSKKDACYHKVKARYDVWPSAYASGALSKCRKVGAANWGNKTKESLSEAILDEIPKEELLKLVRDAKTNPEALDRLEKIIQRVSLSFLDLDSEDEMDEAKKKAGTESSKESSLRDWFGRKGEKGSKGGWVDCNTCRKDKKTGRKTCKACGRSDGDKRSKYPSCRPTPGACGERGRGKSWGKKSSKQNENEEVTMQKEELFEKLLEATMANLKESENYFHIHDATYDDGTAVEEDMEFWDDVLEEAEYQGREVQLNKPMRGDVKKFKVYVKDPSTGNVKKVNFGDPNMKIKKSNPARRKSFRARHNCDNPGPKTKARYWSCRKW